MLDTETNLLADNNRRREQSDMEELKTDLPLANKAKARFDSQQYKHSELTEQIIAAFYETYNELGHGFLESVYEEAIVRVLRGSGLTVEQQVMLPVWFRGEKIGDFYADLIVDRSVILELKACGRSTHLMKRSC